MTNHLCLLEFFPVVDKLTPAKIFKICQSELSETVVRVKIKRRLPEKLTEKEKEQVRKLRPTLAQINKDPKRGLEKEDHENQTEDIKDFIQRLPQDSYADLQFDDSHQHRYSLKSMVNTTSSIEHDSSNISRPLTLEEKSVYGEVLIVGDLKTIQTKYARYTFKYRCKFDVNLYYKHYITGNKGRRILSNQRETFRCIDLQFGMWNPLNSREFCPYWRENEDLDYETRIEFFKSTKKISKKMCFLIDSEDINKIIKAEFPLKAIQKIYVEDLGFSEVSLYFELAYSPKFFWKPLLEDFYEESEPKERWEKFNWDILGSIDDELLRTYAAQSTVIRVSAGTWFPNLPDFLEMVQSRGVPFEDFQANTFETVDLNERTPFLEYELLKFSSLPYETKYALLACISQRKINLFHITDDFLTALEDQNRNGTKLEISIIEKTLKDIASESKGYYGEAQVKEGSPEVFEEAFWKLYNENKESRKLWENRREPEHYIKTKKVSITPTTAIYYLPEAELSNSILRRYQDNSDDFLRVTFTDEKGEELRNAKSISETKFKQVLEDFPLLTRNFKFLAFSSSQLRSSSLWMFSETSSLTTEKIYKDIGDLSEIRIPAKHGARLGQLFSSSFPALKIDKTKINFKKIDDIKKGDYTFSDGIGKISLNLLLEVKKAKKIKGSLSAIQIRCGGVKGVLVGDPQLEENTVCVRPSMIKFTNSSFDTSLEVLDYCRYLPAYLNRQIIILLLTNGVSEDGVISLLEENVRDLSTETAVEKTIMEYINNKNQYSSIKQLLSSCMSTGISISEEPFLHGIAETIRVRSFVNLKDKCSILVKKGVRLMGVLDEYNVLNSGQIYACISPSNGEKEDDLIVLQGRLLVTKNPCLHPGDIRVLEAMNNTETQAKFKHLVNCVVFPSKGPRPHTDEISGSDLDGDVYFLSWDKRLIPPRTSEPMSYAAPPTPKQEVTISDIINFFIDYTNSDVLGRIDNGHLALADRGKRMAASPECIDLAIKHSQAVDYAKTGISPSLENLKFPKKWPDYMEKRKKLSYRSTTALGDAYRSVKIIMEKIGIKDRYKDGSRILDRDIVIDEDMIVDGFEVYVTEAFEALKEYYYNIHSIKKMYRIMTECEIYSGSFLKFLTRKKAKKFNLEKMQETVFTRLEELRAKFSDILRDSVEAGKEEKELMKKASACYIVSYYNYKCEDEKILKAIRDTCPELEDEELSQYFKGQYVGLPWLVFEDVLLQIKQQRMKEKSEAKGNH